MKILSAYVNAGNDCQGETFKQTQDITFQDSDGNFTAIGNQDNHFKGTFDGGNFTISNLTINNKDSNYQGLFGFVDLHGKIKDVHLVNANVKGHVYVGGLVGYTDRGTIENCTSTNGRVSGSDSVGGLVGRNFGAISGTITGSVVSGHQYVGGLVGYSYGTVSGTTLDSTVSGTDQVGGLVGHNERTVSGSSVDNTVSGTGENIGSFVGKNYDTGTVSGYYHNTTDFKGAGDHTDIYLLTLPEGVTATGDDKFYEIGGKYYAEEGASITLINNTLSLKDSDNQSVENDTYTMPAHDSVLFLSTATLPATISTDEGTLKYVVDAQGIPYYAISSVNDLKILSAYVNAGGDTTDMTFKQTQDITFPAVADGQSNFTAIGSNSNKSFKGTFDGGSHTISNLTIQNATTERQGLFGYNSGTIQNLTLSGVNIVTNQERVAAVAGTNHGTIQNCTVTDAVIIGKDFVGALAGSNAIDGRIINNTVSAQVASNGNSVGALVGYNYNEVTGNNFTSNLTEAVGYSDGGTVSNNTSTGTLEDPEIPDGLFSGNDEPVNPQPTFNGQFVQNGNNVQLVDNYGNVLLELSGAKNLNVDDNIYEGNEIDLFATNFVGNKISVVSNAGGFNFYLGEYGSNGYVGSLSGKTFVGNGDNIAVEADGVTVDVSKGNNTIELGNSDGFSVTGFGAGDAIKLAYWRQDCRILGIQQADGGATVMLTDGEDITVSIDGLNVAEVEYSGGVYTTLANGNKVYKANVTEAGAVFDGEKIIGVTEGFMYRFFYSVFYSETDETSFFISGMKDKAEFGLDDGGHSLILNAQYFTANVNVNNNTAGYGILLEGELSDDIDSATFTATDGNDLILNNVSNLKIYGGKGADAFLISGVNETIMDYEADDYIVVEDLNLIVGEPEISGNDVIFHTLNEGVSGQFTVKDAAKLGGITIYDSSGNNEQEYTWEYIPFQFVKKGNNVQLVDDDGNVLLELAGAKDLTVDDNIFDNEIDLFATNFVGNKISVVSNAGGFNFYLGEYEGSLSGKTFVGNGDNIAVEADGVTVDVSKGNNTIEIGYIDEFSVTGFGAGDAIKLSDWIQSEGYRILGIQQADGGAVVGIVKASGGGLGIGVAPSSGDDSGTGVAQEIHLIDSIQTIFIDGLNAANVSPSDDVYTTLNNGNIEVYEVNVTEAGAVFDGEKIVNVTEGFMYEFWDSQNLETLFQISGMNDNATFELNYGWLVLNAEDFTSNVNVNNNTAGYSIALEGKLSDDIDSATFTATDGDDSIYNEVRNLKIYGGKGADEFAINGLNETIMDYEADDRIIVPKLNFIVGSEVSGNDVIFRMRNGGKFTVKDGAKLGEITIQDDFGIYETFEFAENEFNNDDPSKATSAVVNNDFADFGTGQFEKMYSITSAQEAAMIVGNANNNTIVVTGGSDNILIGGLGKDTYSFNDGGGVIADYGIGATKKGNGTALATSTTAANFDRTDPTSYAGEVDVVKVQGTVNGIYFERNNTTTKKDETFTAVISYTSADGDNELIVLKDIVKKPTKTGSSPIYQTNDVAAVTLKIWDTSGSKQAVLSAAKLKNLFKDDDYLSAEQQEQAGYLYALAERENIVVTTQDEESTFISPQIAMPVPNDDPYSHLC